MWRSQSFSSPLFFHFLCSPPSSSTYLWLIDVCESMLSSWLDWLSLKWPAVLTEVDELLLENLTFSFRRYYYDYFPPLESGFAILSELKIKTGLCVTELNFNTFKRNKQKFHNSNIWQPSLNDSKIKSYKTKDRFYVSRWGVMCFLPEHRKYNPICIGQVSHFYGLSAAVLVKISDSFSFCIMPTKIRLCHSTMQSFCKF